MTQLASAGRFPKLSSARPRGGSTGGDRVARAAVAGAVLLSLPLLIPILSKDWRAFYGHHIVGLPFLAALLVAIFSRLRRTEESSERWFWRLIGFGFAWWMLSLGISSFSHVLFPDPTIHSLAMTGPYLVFYGSLIAALEIRLRAVHDAVSRRLQLLDRLGSLSLLVGLVLYFVVVPSFGRHDAHGTWSSSLSLFVALDAHIILRLWFLRGSTRTPRWRTSYTWLLAGAASWGLGDLLWALMHESILADPGYGTALDLIWPLSFAAVVVAVRRTAPADEPADETVSIRRPPATGLLAAYALLPLLMHVSLYRFDLGAPQFRDPRELLVLGITALLAGLAVAYQYVLRVENRRLSKEEMLAREELAHLAYRDELTGLPNRNMFRDRLQLAIAEARRYDRKFGVMFCDVDQFKVINDSLGHDAGDRVLVIAAERLKDSLRAVDTVARLGGDEFAIIVPLMQQTLDAAPLARRLLAAIREPCEIGTRRHVLTASIGVAIFPDDGTEEATLLKHADTAMYQAKLHGRNTFRLFTQAMNEAAQERMAIEQGLRTGLMEDQFSVFYQPIVSTESGAPVAYEALLRWNHPERGFISPISFIDIAEQTGLIVPIGRWILETACRWVAGLEPADGPPPSISVNLSVRQLQDPGFVEDVRRVLDVTGLPPSRLQLEMTESMAILIDSDTSALDTLREWGVRVAIDDFGTGYASLSRLQDLPVDIVKIDRSFVSGIKAGSVNEVIAMAIVNMARALGLYVIAEGVETDAELQVVRQLPCDAVQGYLLCRPLPREELEARPANPVGTSSAPRGGDQLPSSAC